jgi:phasin family protein
MFTVPKQLTATPIIPIDAHMQILNSYTDKALENTRKMIELNLSVSKATLANSLAATQHLLTAKDPQEFFAFSSTQAPTALDNWLSYGRELARIGFSVQNDFIDVSKTQATKIEEQIKDASAQTMHAADMASAVATAQLVAIESAQAQTEEHQAAPQAAKPAIKDIGGKLPE